jgi:hypothetical protein
VGGTISVLPSKIGGLINTREDDIFVFQTKRARVRAACGPPLCRGRSHLAGLPVE